jgi:hypothetical protein
MDEPVQKRLMIKFRIRDQVAAPLGACGAAAQENLPDGKTVTEYIVGLEELDRKEGDPLQFIYRRRINPDPVGKEPVDGMVLIMEPEKLQGLLQECGFISDGEEFFLIFHGYGMA